MLEQFHLHSNSGRPKLKVGLLLDGFVQPAWIASIFDHIGRSDFAAIDFIVLNGEEQHPPTPEPRPPLPLRVLGRLRDPNRRKRFLYGLYTQVEQSRFHPPGNPMQPVDCTEALSPVNAITVQPLTKGFVHRFRPEDLEAIKARDLDVILRFGFNIIRGEILQSARYGVWSYHHGDNDWYRGGPSHFWEMYEDHPVSGVLLQVLSDELDGGAVLCKSWLATQPGLWVTLNRIQPYWTGSFFVIRKLHELHQYGWEYVRSRSVPNRFVEGRKKIYRAPENATMVRFAVPRLLRRAQVALRPPRVYHWRMAIRNHETSRNEAWRPGQPLSLEGFQWIEAPRGHFWADPFVCERDGRTWLFFEDFLYSEDRGVIACAELSPDGKLSDPVRVLDLPYHLSFPFVFEDGGETYMIPESGWNRTVELWRATRFPYEWKKERTLFEGAHAFDTVLWRNGGLYWFFVTLVDPRAAGPQLFLFHSDSLTGPWTYHPANPIGPDVRSARNAGAIFMHDGRLYRPSQSGAPRYGYACHIHEILRLTPGDYEEQMVATLEPPRGMAGVHTYNRGSSIEVIDGQWLSPKHRHVHGK
jgi:hypothetical protein